MGANLNKIQSSYAEYGKEFSPIVRREAAEALIKEMEDTESKFKSSNARNVFIVTTGYLAIHNELPADGKLGPHEISNITWQAERARRRLPDQKQTVDAKEPMDNIPADLIRPAASTLIQLSE